MNTTLNNNETPEEQVADDLLFNRPRQPGRHYLLSPESRSLAIEIAGQPYIDRTTMSARAIISTPTVDRGGDVLDPLGCKTANYSKNPVVLWSHGMEGIGFPIATSRDPNGNLAVFISDQDVQATCWFSQKSLDAVQIFELIDEGIVRATSVRETPIKSHVERDPQGGDLLIVDEWDLEEWSWCAVGVNPDAVAKTLHRNRLGGRPITRPIMKALIAVAPTLKRFGHGLPKEKGVKDLCPPDQNGLDANANNDAMSSADNCEPDVGSQPYGSTVVSAIYSSLATVCQNISDALGPLENPSVKEGLMAILASLEEQATALQGLYSSSYPDQPTLKSDDDDDDDDEESMKAFLASGHVASLRVLGLGARLKGLVGAPNITRAQRQSVNDVIRQMANLVSEAKSQHSGSHDAKIAVLKNSIQELTEMVARLKR